MKFLTASNVLWLRPHQEVSLETPSVPFFTNYGSACKWFVTWKNYSYLC